MECGATPVPRESCKLCRSVSPFSNRQPEYVTSAEARELALDAARGGGSAGDIEAGLVEPGERGANGGRRGFLLRPEKEWTAGCGGAGRGGKRVRKVGATCDRDSALCS